MAKIAVIGDVMLDQYSLFTEKENPELKGSPGWKIKQRSYLPGGAANVARNLARLGSRTILLGRVGDDWAGIKLEKVLERENINYSFEVDKRIQTTLKERIIHQESGYYAGRKDEEGELVLAADGVNEILGDNPLFKLEDIPNVLENLGGCDAVIFSDYNKGMIIPELVQAVKATGIPILADIKPVHKNLFRNVYLIKPNLKEAREMTGIQEGIIAGEKLTKEISTDVLLTLGAQGIAYFHPESGHMFSLQAKAREVRDPVGCGDNVIATYAHFRFTRDRDLREAAFLANIAAGIAVGHRGCYAPTEEEIFKEK
jgi:D-beta-D-heptose 7-phosphate kinase/D-beta-D-heptose 1-phosphate adenosyltransferase